MDLCLKIGHEIHIFKMLHPKTFLSQKRVLEQAKHCIILSHVQFSVHNTLGVQIAMPAAILARILANVLFLNPNFEFRL